MVTNFDDINPLYSADLLGEINSELKKEKDDIEELSQHLDLLISSFSGASKSDITNSVKLKLKLKTLPKYYRKLFFTLINIAMNDAKNGTFITLNYDKIYHFGNSKQIKTLNICYQNILKFRNDDSNFSKKEFKNFIKKCANIVNKIVSVIIITPNSDLLVKAVDIMDMQEI
jgi:hypothetical protein